MIGDSTNNSIIFARHQIAERMVDATKSPDAAWRDHYSSDVKYLLDVVAAHRAAVAKFLNEDGHGLCHTNRKELAEAFNLALPGKEWPLLPSEQEFALGCIKYRQELYGPGGPGSDQEVFLAEIARLKEIIQSLTVRVAAQSELLSRRAAAGLPPRPADVDEGKE